MLRILRKCCTHCAVPALSNKVYKKREAARTHLFAKEASAKKCFAQRTKQLLALALCFALALGCIGCGRQPAQEFLPQSTPVQNIPEQNAPETGTPAVTYAQVQANTSFDAEAFRTRLAAASLLLEAEDAGQAVMDEYRTLTQLLKECLTWYTLCDIAGYTDAADTALQSAAADAHEIAVECTDAFSEWLGKLARSQYRQQYIDAAGEENVRMYEDYLPLTQLQKQLLDREKELQNEYRTLAAAPYASYAECAQAVAPLYVELVELRSRIAESFGYENYVEYAYAETYARSYTPQDALTLCAAVKQTLAPLYVQSLLEESRSSYHAYAGSDETDEQTLLALLEKFLAQISPEMQQSLEYMLAAGSYDIAYSSKKFDAGFTTLLHSADMPFLFIQPVQGSQFHSLNTLVHEFGHFHAYRTDPVGDTPDGFVYSRDDIDAAEIHSTALELFFWQYLPQLYGNGAPALQKEMLTETLGNVVFGCMMDEFQQLVYTAPELQPQDVSDIFYGVMLDYMGDIFIEDYARHYWAEVNHNFDAPLYYISYGVSALAAFEIWAQAQQDRDAALQQYLQLVSYGTDVELLPLLEECGLQNVFEGAYLEELETQLRRALQ